MDDTFPSKIYIIQQKRPKVNLNLYWITLYTNKLIKHITFFIKYMFEEFESQGF